MKTQWNKLGLSMLVSFLPGIIGSLFMMGTIDTWYATLNKPWFTPPNWLFAPVWTMLYVLMGVSLYLVWTKKASSEVKSDAYFYFFAQLAFNGLWTPVFFYIQVPVIGLLIILLLYGLVIMTMITFYKTSKKAAYLLIPYIVWLTIATLLNYFIIILN